MRAPPFSKFARPHVLPMRRYIVDDTGAGNSVAFCMESDVNAELRKAYGYTMYVVKV